jgi:hypothetical protein
MVQKTASEFLEYKPSPVEVFKTKIFPIRCLDDQEKIELERE